MLTDGHFKVMSRLVDKEMMFAKPAITVSRGEMTRLIKSSKENWIRVWSTKLNGVRFRRNVKSGPKIGRPVYNYQAKGYWVVQSEINQDGANPYGWRTLVLKNVEKVKIGQQIYKVK